jgi:hypothetical protein
MADIALEAIDLKEEIMFKNIDIKTLKLDDLVGRKLDIRSFKDGSTELICAKDTETGEIFVIKEIHHDDCADKNT